MSLNTSERPRLKAIPKTQVQLVLSLFFLFVLVALLVVIFVKSDGLRNMSNDFVIISMIAGLFVLGAEGFAFKGYLRSRKLDKYGKMTMGTIIGGWTTRDFSADNEEESKNYYLAYKFGDNVCVKQKVSEQTHMRLLFPGTSVPVRYLPDDPTCSRMEIN